MYWHMISHIGQVLYTGIINHLFGFKNHIDKVFMYWHKSSQFGKVFLFSLK